MLFLELQCVWRLIISAHLQNDVHFTLFDSSLCCCYMVYKAWSKHTAVTHGLEYYASAVLLGSYRHHIPSCL